VIERRRKRRVEHMACVGERRGVVLEGTFGGTITHGILGKDGMKILKLNVNKEDRERGLN
jgi:hypothetical protein